MRSTWIGVMMFLLATVTGCSTTLPYANDASKVAAVRAVQDYPTGPEMALPAPEEGSLWSDAVGVCLFTDQQARRIGDIVTVRIVEDPEAELNANTKTSRSSGVSAGKLKLFGYMKALAGKNPLLAQNPGEEDLFSAALESDFDGKGSSDRDGHVKAYVAARVVQVLPNQNLYIQGKREIRVNNETQYIVVSGLVRPQDIGPGNEVSSAYLADARIIYSGIGPLADKQKPGWLGRVVDHVWPF